MGVICINLVDYNQPGYNLQNKFYTYDSWYYMINTRATTNIYKVTANNFPSKKPILFLHMQNSQTLRVPEV